MRSLKGLRITSTPSLCITSWASGMLVSRRPLGPKCDPDYDPQDLGNIRKVELSHALLGYFRPVSCGGSCAPANIWWKDGRVLYQIQLGFPSTLREGDQQKTIISAADSAILAGPPLRATRIRLKILS
jgi:hypothetical protein